MNLDLVAQAIGYLTIIFALTWTLCLGDDYILERKYTRELEKRKKDAKDGLVIRPHAPTYWLKK